MYTCIRTFVAFVVDGDDIITVLIFCFLSTIKMSVLSPLQQLFVSQHNKQTTDNRQKIRWEYIDSRI